MVNKCARTASLAGNNMLVAVRMRPLSRKEIQGGEKSCCQVVGNKIVAITKAKRPGAVLKSEMGSVNEYQFDEAFDEKVPQIEVYKRTAARLIPSVLEGFNVTVFAYGATGAGKTHTMMGSERMDAERATGAEGGQTCGIIPLTLIDIFKGMKQKQAEADLPDEKWSLSVSYLEVYNEKIRDLLEPSGINLPVQEDPKAGIVGVGGLAKRTAANSDQVMELLRYGNTNRRTHATDANATSSRSHAVLQIIMSQSWSNSKGKNITRESRVNLIDLAGSERAGKTNNRGKRLQEGANINRSLLALANCINALAQGTTRKNAKYRDSKLTHLLKSSLEGQCKLIIIANINPSDQMFEDSHNTLKYANRAKCMKIDPKVVRLQERDLAWPEREKNLQRQREAKQSENDHLKQQVEALQAMLNGNCPVLPNNGMDVLSNLKIQVANDEAGTNRGAKSSVPVPPAGPSPTNSCPGVRGGKRSRIKRTKSMSSASSVASLDSGALAGKKRPAFYRRRSAMDIPDSNLVSINEDKSVKEGRGEQGQESMFDIDIDDVDLDDEQVGVKLPEIARGSSEKSLMDMSDISDISAHESIIQNGFDENAPVGDRLGALESKVMGMAQSRKLMLDFITNLQAQKDDAEAEKEEARQRAEKAEREILEQKALVNKLQAMVELERANVLQAQKDKVFADEQRKAVFRKTGLQDDEDVGVPEEEGVLPEPLDLREIRIGNSGEGPRTDGVVSSRTPPRARSDSSDSNSSGGRPVTGGRRIVQRKKDASKKVLGDSNSGNVMKQEQKSTGGKPVKPSAFFRPQANNENFGMGLEGVGYGIVGTG
ncbi:hypothetical protein TrVE_jg11889 [Triparma verrucosa]|uniref:Kinesin-like protein n=1 Tax=Triparma verrucosa TaxID=1606542 RepID=A0A9W7C0W9_9STRA|nr:hypothetical protein TrVE_jg11889 [Triparma verrucosa]